jgi:hypothetical protein
MHFVVTLLLEHKINTQSPDLATPRTRRDRNAIGEKLGISEPTLE